MKRAAILSYFTRQAGPMLRLVSGTLHMRDKKSGYIGVDLDKK